MNVNFLARAVSMYLNDNSPVTPEEYNFQAELKAASHWRFLNENEQIKFVSGPYDYEQVKVAAAFALRRWIEELSEIESGETDAHKMQDDDRDDSRDTSSIEERISDLEEDIFSLRMFYNMTLEEKEYKSSPKTREDCNGLLSMKVSQLRCKKNIPTKTPPKRKFSEPLLEKRESVEKFRRVQKGHRFIRVAATAVSFFR